MNQLTETEQPFTKLHINVWIDLCIPCHILQSSKVKPLEIKFLRCDFTEIHS